MKTVNNILLPKPFQLVYLLKYGIVDQETKKIGRKNFGCYTFTIHYKYSTFNTFMPDILSEINRLKTYRSAFIFINHPYQTCLKVKIKSKKLCF